LEILVTDDDLDLLTERAWTPAHFSRRVVVLVHKDKVYRRRPGGGACEELSPLALDNLASIGVEILAVEAEQSPGEVGSTG
jgi:hypothetical protein